MEGKGGMMGVSHLLLSFCHHHPQSTQAPNVSIALLFPLTVYSLCRVQVLNLDLPHRTQSILKYLLYRSPCLQEGQQKRRNSFCSMRIPSVAALF